MKQLPYRFSPIGLTTTEFIRFVSEHYPRFLKLPRIVISGTNGKGTTAAHCSALLKTLGYQTGLFTSPHIQHLEERLAINGTFIEEGELSTLAARFTERFAASFDPATVTFFQFITLLAIQWFLDQEVEAVVLEVGLGGRLDPTNLPGEPIAVITSIGLDHGDQLGWTTRAILNEKLPIARPGGHLIFAERDLQLRTQALQYCQEHGVQLHFIDAASGESVSSDLAISKASRLAVATLFPKTKSTIEKLGDLRVQLPGRRQQVNNFTLDIAHNPSALLNLLAWRPFPKILVLAKPYRKEWGDLSVALGDCGAQIFLPKIDYQEAGSTYFESPGALLASLGLPIDRVRRFADLRGALAACENASSCISGSSRLVGLALDLLGVDTRQTPIHR